MKISIRWALIIGVLGLIWITQLISTTSAYFSSQNVLLHHSRDIMQNIADLTIEQSKNHLNLAQSAAHLTKRLMASEVVSSTYSQLDALERYFLDQLAIYPHFAGIYVGKPNGDFYYVSRDDTYAPNGFRTKIINRQAGDRQTLLKWRDAKGRLVQTTPDPTDTFDPRARPWYRRAMADNTIVWTDPYIFFTSQKPGITIAGPIFHASGGLQAIVGVDIEIDHLSTFISKLRIGKNGRAFMINNNGDVVAFPDVDKLTIRKTQEGDTARLVKISELDDAIAIAAFQAIDWTGRNGDRFELDGPQFARFTYNGRVFDTMFTPFVDSKWPWIIGVYLPESDYLGGIRSNRRFNVLITLALSFIATLIGLRLVRGIIRPLAALEKEALAIKRRDLTQNHDTGSAFSEIQETADAFTRMKTELRQSEEKYRSIFENIQDIYYEVTLEGQILEVSPSVKKVTHLSRRELIGMSMDTLYEDVSTRQNFLEVIQRVGRVDDFEIRLKDKNGNVLHSAITAVLKRSPEGKPIKIIGSLRVINDRKRAESELLRYQNHLEELVRERTQDHERINRQLLQEVETRREKEDELRKSEEKYRSVIENMDNGYYEMDLKGNLTFFNDPLANMLGYTREEMMRLHYRDYLALDMLAIVQKRLATVRQTGMAAALSRHTLVGKDGRRKTVEASIALITDAEGQPLGYSGVVLDVTMKLDAEREKKKLEERLQQIQRLEGIGTLAGGVAHDFNNLLMGIQGNVSLTLLTTPPGHPNYEKLKNIEACVVGGSDLTRQLLGFARGGKYSSKTMDLNQVVHTTVGMFGRTRKDIRIVEKLRDDIWPVMGDQGQIEQVLLNLCINAWQAMPDGGNIYFETKNIELDASLVQPLDIPVGRYVCISVADMGIGMDEATQNRIFEPFFTTKEIGRGTGLGLASAYGIIKNHDGAIDFVSRVGEGTTFYIYLPVSESPVCETKVTTTAPTKGAGTILLVDDEKMVLDVNKSMLEQLGYKVLSALGGRPAIEIFDHTKELIDLVILDMVMPDMNGAAVFDHFISQRPDIKVLLSSGHSLSEQTEALIKRGCKGFIQKPYKLEELGARIQELLRTGS